MNSLKKPCLPKLLFLLAASFFAFPALAAESTEPLAMNGLFNAEYFDLASKHTGDNNRIFVARPMVVEPGKRYPVIYALDGNGAFGIVSDIARLMALGNELPQAFVVGIGYPVENGFVGAMAKRYRDYTPTPGGELESLTQRMSDPSGQVKPGGGPAFLAFLRDELKPAIESRYPVDPQDATLGGASLGGLFPAWVMLTEPEIFQRYVIISPSIWWNGEEVWQWEQQYADNRKDLQAIVFVTAGGLEVQAEMKKSLELMKQSGNPARDSVLVMEAAYTKNGWPRMAEITPEFVAKLESRNYPGLTIKVHNMPEETHLSVVAGAWSRGLRYVFGHWGREAANE